MLSTDVPIEGFTGEVRPLVRALKTGADPRRKEAGQFATMVAPEAGHAEDPGRARPQEEVAGEAGDAG
ncbi:MAG: hypothetical protein ACRD1K_05855 [Acidimicrobiales bacterium]